MPHGPHTKIAVAAVVLLLLSGCLKRGEPTNDPEAHTGLPGDELPASRSQNEPTVALETQLTNCTLIGTFILTPRDTISAQGPDEWRSTTIHDWHMYYTFICTRVGFAGAERGPLAFVLETISVSNIPARCEGPAAGVPEFVYAIHADDAQFGSALSRALGAPAYNSSIDWGPRGSPGEMLGRLEIQPLGHEASFIDAPLPVTEATRERPMSVSFFYTNETTTARLTLDASARQASFNDYRGLAQFREPAMASQSHITTYPIANSYAFDYNASGVVLNWDEPLCGS